MLEAGESVLARVGTREKGRGQMLLAQGRALGSVTHPVLSTDPALAGPAPRAAQVRL